MARPTKEQALAKLHDEALRQFSDIQTALRDERKQCLEDRRFYSIAGAMWEGPLQTMYENRPRMEVNKVHLAVIRIINEYRNNRVTVDFQPREADEASDKLAETCDALYRADEHDSGAQEAYDNAFEEGVGGGFGAWRVRAVYEDESDPENERQRIRIEPIYDADSSVYFDLGAKRQDKADARFAYVIYSMPREQYKEEWGDDPSDWPKVVHQYEFDWATPDVVFLAEYYRVEEVSDTIRTYRAIDGSEEKYRDADFEADETLEETLAAVGTIEVRRRKVTRRRVRKYIMSGGKVLEDCGLIAGECIPIVPYFGKRWFVDNVERCMGHVRLAKDAQRLKNMQLSKLAEIAALSSLEKPIFVPEQIVGHQEMWSQDNLKDYPYLLVNQLTGADGSAQPSGPVAYTKPPTVPPAMAALLQVTETDMQEILGANQEAEKMVSNISGKAVEMIQQRLDMQTYIYMSNFAVAMKRCGEIWLSIAREIYTERGRKMKGMNDDAKPTAIELMRPVVGESGSVEYENDLASAKLDANVEVGPSSSSRRSATVRALTGMLAITNDPETQQVLQAMAIMNMEGEGISDVRNFFRQKLVRIGALKPSEEEAAQMQQAAQQPDPNEIFLNAAAEEAVAKAAQARANTVKTVADAELTRAKTVETLANINATENVERQSASMLGTGAANMKPQAAASNSQSAMIPTMQTAKELLELEAMQIENEIKRRTLEEQEAKVFHLQDQIVASQTYTAGNQEMLSAMDRAVSGLADAVGKMNSVMRENADRAIAAISRPKRLIRERGRISRIETE